MNTNLKSVSLVNSVFFLGASVRQITPGTPTAGTTLEMDSSGRGVLVTPANPERDALFIPMTNVACVVLVDAARETRKKAADEKKLSKQGAKAKALEAAAADAPPAPVIRGTIKFTKDPETGAIIETVV